MRQTRLEHTMGACLRDASLTGGLPAIEWPTVCLIFLSYSIWLLLALAGQHLHMAAWIAIAAINTTLFMSITHEVVHGHPTRIAIVNRLLLLVPIAWSIPYERFRDTHMAHHDVEELTDPFDDPESWYLAHNRWLSRSWLVQTLLHFNNTLAGRMIVGPAISLFRFYVTEATEIFQDRIKRRYLLVVWAKHVAMCAVMAWFLFDYCAIPAWQVIAALYLGHSVLLIRTFLEHQAVPGQGERTVIIEKTCPLAFLFLFNNYHFIHHEKPGIPWYQLPGIFRTEGKEYIKRNGAYTYPSYGDIFRRYFLHSKEPVPHPFLRKEP